MTVAKGSADGERVRPQLDRNLILTVAMQLAASGAPITIRALGKELAADPTALYRHFRTRQDLIQAMFDRLLVGVNERIDLQASWRERLSDVAQQYWNSCEHYPSVGAEGRTLITGGPGEIGAVELFLQSFREAGLDRSDAVRFYAVYSDYLTSVGTTLATARLLATNDGTEPDGVWLGDVGIVDAKRYPEVVASREQLASLRQRDIFQMGVGVILDAAESAGRTDA